MSLLLLWSTKSQRVEVSVFCLLLYLRFKHRSLKSLGAYSFPLCAVATGNFRKFTPEFLVEWKAPIFPVFQEFIITITINFLKCDWCINRTPVTGQLLEPIVLPHLSLDNMRTFSKLNRQMRFSLPSVKCFMIPPPPSTVSLSELFSTIWLPRLSSELLIWKISLHEAEHLITFSFQLLLVYLYWRYQGM